MTRIGFKTGGGSCGKEASGQRLRDRDPYHEAEARARVLLREIQAFLESEEGQREFADRKGPAEN